MNEVPNQPLIVSVAPNGAIKNKSDHNNIPLSKKEIVETAKETLKAGASMIHLHVRDENGKHTLDSKIYRETISSIRTAVGKKLIIQITTESVGMYDPYQQMKLVREVKPESASIAIREIVMADNHSDLREFFNWCYDKNIMLQYILYTKEDIMHFLLLKKSRIIPQQKSSLLFVLGKSSITPPQPKNLVLFLNELGKDESVWSVCGFGKNEAVCCFAAAILGGHVRVGFENNLELIDGSIAPNNAALVSQIVSNLNITNRSLADANSARDILTK